MIPALTLHRPWPEAICRHGKLIENRVWAPPPKVRGRPMLLHAGAYFDGAGADAIRELGFSVTPKGEAPQGLVGICRVVGVLREGPTPLSLPRVASVYDRAYQKHVESLTTSPWFSGPWGWVLADVVELPEAVPCKGALGLWTPGAEALGRVLEMLGAAGFGTYAGLPTLDEVREVEARAAAILAGKA